MQKNSITNKITPCCGLPFSVIYWWVSNLNLNSESDRQFLFSQLRQNGTLSIDGWKTLVNSGTLEADASLTKAEFLAWFDCGKQPTCEQLKLLIEAYKIGNWTPETELPSNLALIDAVVNGVNYTGNVYTKEQTDDKIADGFALGIVGEAIPTTDPPETGFYRYIVHEAGTYTNFGGIVVTNSDLDGNMVFLEVTDNVAKKVVVSIPLLPVNGIVEAGNTDAVSGGEVYQNLIPILDLDNDVQYLKERTPLLSDSDDLFHFQDLYGALVMVVDKDGYFSFYPTEKTKNEINVIKTEDINGFIFAILDYENKIIFGIKDNGDIVPNITDNGGGKDTFNQLPYNKEKGSLILAKTETIKEFINLPSTAIGRESAEGADDAPEVPLTIGGYTHPSVLFVGSGWNGFRYWMAITPTFGVIAQQPDSASYENPHIFCSNDGINWQQPNGIINPIDTPPHAPFNGYWSDTHLMLLPDGYLYCIYRGNSMPNKKLGISENPNSTSIVRADVYKRSKDGVNWEDFTFIQGTNNAGLNGNGGIMSPAFVFDNGYINCFDVVWSTTEHPYVGEGQYGRIVMRRLAKDFDEFKNTPYTQDNVVNFKNRAWQENHDVWHLDACKWGNTWFLLLNTSETNLSTGSDLYLAYSGDGWNFDVIEQPISLGTSYRSCIVPLSYNGETIEFLLFNNFKTDGSTFLKKITLNYNL